MDGKGGGGGNGGGSENEMGKRLEERWRYGRRGVAWSVGFRRIVLLGWQGEENFGRERSDEGRRRRGRRGEKRVEIVRGWEGIRREEKRREKKMSKKKRRERGTEEGKKGR
ncbi:hypothetical protein Tco_0111790 [Tanacetum coccineum]